MHRSYGSLLMSESAGFSGRLRLTLSGCLDIATAPQLEARLQELEKGRARVELDLALVDFIDLQGLRVIHSRVSDSRLSGAGQGAPRFQVRPKLGPCVKRLVELVGVDLWPTQQPGALPTAFPRRSARVRTRTSDRRRVARR